jgi:putative RNA 2'-phosphotransferase
MLRHSAEPLYIDLNGGWADVNIITKALKERFPQVSRAIMDEIVANDEKGRYSFNADRTKIRANQGHSIPGVIIEMEQPEPPEYLYHGTATRFLDSIMRNGLIPMSRQYVHISPDFETAVKVGKRHGKPVIFVIDAKRFVADGNELYLSANGVWQAKQVPSEYFTIKYVE